MPALPPQVGVMMYSLSLTIGPQTSWLVQGMNGMGHRKHIGPIRYEAAGGVQYAVE